MGKKIAVIGGGCCGLTAIKCCVDENLEPVCFERTDEIGGLWNFTEKVRDSLGCVMRTTIINTSKEMMCYSDFPVPKEFPNYMHNTKVWEYFKLYMDHFGLEKYIKYNTEVLHVKPASNFENTGQWEVEVGDHMKNEVTKHTFDGVLVCTGHHARKHEPKFASQEEFQGKILHSHDFKDTRGYEGKRVVVIGIGNSGGDTAVELSRCSKVFLSTRRGTWVFYRVYDNGLPVDMVVTTRMFHFIAEHMPTSFLDNHIQKKLNARFDHRLYNLEPAYSVSAQHPMVNDDMPNRILSGTLIIKTDIKKFTKTGIEFVDGTFEDNIDVVILATGYRNGYPFIDKSVIDVKMNRIELFKYMFPPDLAKPTLAVIGCIQPNGAIMPIAELQCRLATKVFKGDIRLPERSAMWADIREKEAKLAKRFVQTQRHTIQVTYIDFMDQLAELIGCKPNLGKLLLSDPKLAVKCWFGPCIPAQFRLTGPGKWAGAREVIMTSWDRLCYPLQTRPLPEGLKTSKTSLPLKLMIMIVIAAILYMIIF